MTRKRAGSDRTRCPFGSDPGSLAEAAKVSALYISQIERRSRVGSPAVLGRIARALNMTVDDLLPHSHQPVTE